MAETFRRQPCAWCDQRDRWPDRCAENDDPTCAEIIEQSCSTWADHRRCTPETCEFSAEWHPRVRDAGITECAKTGQDYAVVGVVGSVVAVHGTNDHLGRAKSLIRARAVKAAGFDATDPEGKGLVYVVRRDGQFL